MQWQECGAAGGTYRVVCPLWERTFRMPTSALLGMMPIAVAHLPYTPPTHASLTCWDKEEEEECTCVL